MRLLIVGVIVVAAAVGVYVYATREGPAEQAGRMADEALDKAKRIIDVVTE